MRNISHLKEEKMKRIIALIAAVVMLLSLAVPSLASPAPSYDKDARKVMGDDYLKKLSDFSSKLYALCDSGKEANYTMSPLSVFFAFSMLHYAGDDEVKREIESFTGMSGADLERAGELFNCLINSYSYNGTTACELSLSNSVWNDDNVNVNQSAIDYLADKLSCISKSAPFKNDNENANALIRAFIKEQTHGLIDRDFKLPDSVAFALINTLYFKDVWNIKAEELGVVEKLFETPDGKRRDEFVRGYYSRGQIAETETSYYYTQKTEHNYKVKFILPKEGYTLDDAMSAENITKVNMTDDFRFVDENGAYHYTRCLFPEFKTVSDTPLKTILKNSGAFSHTFAALGFDSVLTDDSKLAVSDIKHSTVLDVNRKGVEGAAVTIALMPASGPPENIVEIYHDFILNRGFGYLVTDKYDVVLFAGRVADPAPGEALANESELTKGVTEMYDGTFAVDIPCEEQFKVDGIGAVRFNLVLKNGDDELTFDSVDGIDQDKVAVTENEDGTVTLEVSDLEKIASVQAGDVLFRVRLLPETKYPVFDEKLVKDTFSYKSETVLAEVDVADVADAPRTVSKQTGDPLVILALLSAIALASLCAGVVLKKKYN